MTDPLSLLSQLDELVSEQRHPDTQDLDLLTTDQLLAQINDEDQKVPQAVRQQLPQISQAVDKIVAAFQAGGRLIYMGAGTSGRLGVLDAVECPPTYSVLPNMVTALIAGGERAIMKAVEGAEDDVDLAIADLKALNFTAQDLLVGIAASGRTPYVLAGLAYARQLGAVTVSLSCNPGSLLTKAADIAICPVVGPEVLTGSTRMKAGTAQKLVLNMLTTASMVKLGKVYQNLMVDLQTTNEKLHARAMRIVMQASGCDVQTATTALSQCDGVVKVAILHTVTGVDPAQCRSLLSQTHGILRQAIELAQQGGAQN